MNQRTLKESFSLTSKGLHTGLNLTVEFCPAPENFGYKIQRTDVEGSALIPALADHVVDTSRCTILSNGREHVGTIEHGLSALYALGIDNCLMKVNGPEFPILDGSARYYVENIHRVGTVCQNAAKQVFVVDETIELYDEKRDSRLILEPADEFSVSTTISFENSIINDQHADLHHLSEYADEYASARTFVFVRDLDPLLSAGLIKGGDLDNAIVIYERKLSQEKYNQLADIMKVPHMDANHLGYIMHRPLVWDNEPARHKLLDIIGDIALVGCPIQGRITAIKPGHSVNTAFARLVRKHLHAYASTTL